MKDICRKISQAQAKAHKTQQKLLEKELETLLSSPSIENTVKQISEICEERGTIHLQQVAGIKIRSKDRFFNDNEKQIKYFFSLENSRQSQRNITKLIDDNGNVQTGKDQILSHIADFYIKLYTEELTDIHAQQKLLDSIHRRLPTDVSETLEGEPGLDESYEALSKMPVQKSPGTDGFPAEFYTMS